MTQDEFITEMVARIDKVTESMEEMYVFASNNQEYKNFTKKDVSPEQKIKMMNAFSRLSSAVSLLELLQ